MANPLSLIVSLISLALFAQTVFSVYLMLYAWHRPEQLEAGSGPRSFLPPRLSFTVLLPARREEAVIFETIKRVLSAHYPEGLVEVLVICHVADAGTIAEVERARRELGDSRLRVETFADGPVTKPHALNVGLQRSSYDVVTVFDAEDDIDADIFNVINTVMQEEETGIVQGGVQLMNFRDHWFGSLNCLEYFFWFKSRLHFHAHVGMIPLGGNTVFVRRPLLEGIGGWDQHCLTEDADVGIRLSALGEPIRVVYDAQHVTREETPPSVAAFVRQRTRWSQGFLQVLGKGTWRALPRRGQRILALYTLGYPLLQAALMLLWPITLAALFWLKLPVPVVMVSFLPFYAFGLQYLVNVVGAYQFCREYQLRFPLLLPIGMAISFFPFQWLLGLAALRAVYRQLSSQYNWEKTAHLGAHRRREVTLAADFAQLLDEAGAQLGAERGSVLLLDPASNTFSVLASRGLPEHVARGAELDASEGIAGWAARTGQPAIVDGRPLPRELRGRTTQPAVRSAVVLPLTLHGDTVAVLSVSSALPTLGEDALLWLKQRCRQLSVDPARLATAT